MEDVRSGQAGHRPPAKGQRDHGREDELLNRLTYFDMVPVERSYRLRRSFGEDWRDVEEWGCDHGDGS